MDSTANMTGILSTMAEAAPTTMLAVVAPQEPYMTSEASTSQPQNARPPTLKMMPKKNSSVSHSEAATALW